MSHSVRTRSGASALISWGSPSLALVALSLPFLDFPGVGGAAYVKPLALLIALPILAFRLVTRPTTIAFPSDMSMRYALLFWGWAVVGSILMPWMTDAPTQFKGQSLGDRVLRDMLSMSAGFLFWIFIRMELRTPTKIIQAVRLMLVSFWIVLAFCLAQALVIVTDSDVAKALDSLLSVFRTMQPPGYRKIFGVAPEASMLADQLMTMYFPFVVASIFQNTPFFRTFGRGVSVERIMFILGFGILLFTLSRIGFVAVIALLICAYILGPKLTGGSRKRIPLALIVAVGVIFAIGVSLTGTLFSSFLGSFGGIDASIDEGVWSNVTRAGSMTAGVGMALDHPFGVGTGVFPFLFERYVPDWALVSPEIQALMGTNYEALFAVGGSTSSDIAERLPDAKALPVRVLAELGWPGLLILAGGWLYQVRSCWRVARSTQVPIERVIAFGCVLSLLVMVPLSFSVNSYIWVHWLFISAVATSLVCLQERRCRAAWTALEPLNEA